MCVCRDLSFLIHWDYERIPNSDGGCDRMDSYREGIELSLRRPGDLTWRPIAYFVRLSPPPDFRIRGYDVPHIIVNDSDIQHSMRFRLCDKAILEAGVQFRWLQRVMLHTGSFSRDLWSLDDVLVTVTYSNCFNTALFYEDFETGIIR